jgi:hypothetical protein
VLVANVSTLTFFLFDYAGCKQYGIRSEMVFSPDDLINRCACMTSGGLIIAY